MNVIINPGAARGRAEAPPSKSCAHRVLICSVLARESSALSNISLSEDIMATVDCAAALGGASRIFPCRESGSTLRFLIPLSLVLGGGGVFTGSPRLFQRGVGIYEDILTAAKFEKIPGGLSVSGVLKPGGYSLRGDVSSQFVTGLLLALPLLDGDSELRILPPVESRPYIDITVDILKAFGVRIAEPEKNRFLIDGGQEYKAASVRVEGDWSNAAFLHALNELGGSVQVDGLDPDSLQGDRVCLELFKSLRSAGAVIDVSSCPDLGPILFALAAARHGAVFTGTRRLRIKESDRAQAMAEELAKFGVPVQVGEDTVTVGCGLRRPSSVLSGHNDHRIVMALAVLAAAVGGEISGAEAIKKSYPDFFDVLRSLGVEVLDDIG